MPVPNYRFAIQIISFNRPEYLDKTLESLMKVVDSNRDKIAVIEQSDTIEIQKTCIKICQKYKNVQVYPLFKNLGQRGATNYLYHLKYFDDAQFIMLSDHDNIFHDDLSEYENCLNIYPECWITTGYHSPEHDIENKKDKWLCKTTCRAGHIVMRTEDFKSVMPVDPNYGDCAWFAGLNN